MIYTTPTVVGEIKINHQIILPTFFKKNARELDMSQRDHM